MKNELRLSAGLVSLSLLASAGVAHAYCRTSSCLEASICSAEGYQGAQCTGKVCVPATPTDCGAATTLHWPQPCTEWSLQQDASKQVTFAAAGPLVTQAFQAWMSATCPGGGSPNVKVSEGPPATCHKAEYNQTQHNAYIVMFDDDGWPYSGTAYMYNTLALTTVTYDVDSGDIYDADMEINSADNTFTTGDTGVDYDLLSVVTHEAGHFLGLAHTATTTATMYAMYQEGSISKRDLAADDIAAICAAYPPAAPESGCDPTPRHGFSPLCAADQPPDDAAGTGGGGGGGGAGGEGASPTVTAGCSSSAGGGGAGGEGLVPLLAAWVLAARRRRR